LPLGSASGAFITGHIRVGVGHLDEMFVRINGETHYLWRAVDHEGEILKVFATKRRDLQAALKFIKRTMKRYGRPWTIVTDRLRSYGAAMKVIGNLEYQECGRWLNNRAAALAEWRQLAA
jgi:putative transposase